MPLAVGVDGAGSGWVAVGLRNAEFAFARYFPDLADLLESNSEAGVIAIDLPIGLAEGLRTADVEARAMLGQRRSSLFPMPPRGLADLSYEEARMQWAGRPGAGFSKQTWAVVAKVVAEQDLIRRLDPVGSRIIEVHPELSFMEMAGQPMAASKRTWNGLQERFAVLASGMGVPADLGDLGPASADDVLDAFAAAWTAERFSRGAALSVPEHATNFYGDRPIQIWR